MWKIMLACAYHAKEKCMPMLNIFLLELAPRLIPCHECRLHFRVHKPIVSKRVKGDPKNSLHALKWIHTLKDEVNKSLKPPVKSMDFEYIKKRLDVSDGFIVTDVEVADLLVLISVEANDLARDNDFIQMCKILYSLLPISKESHLRNHLQHMCCPIVDSCLICANDVRAHRGLPRKTQEQYLKHVY